MSSGSRRLLAERDKLLAGEQYDIIKLRAKRFSERGIEISDPETKKLDDMGDRGEFIARVSKSAAEARESFRLWLVENCGGCAIQGGADGKGWPCGTCVIHLFASMGVREDDDHNDPVERCNEVWRAILQIRGDDIKHEGGDDD